MTSPLRSLVVALLFAFRVTHAQEPTIDPKIVAAYEKLGGKFGNVDVDPYCYFQWYAPGVENRVPEERSRRPAFAFDAEPKGALPDPGTPFVLFFHGGKPPTDATLKRLKDLENLEALCLAYGPISDAGMKDLSHLRKLRILNCYRVPITDAGLKELAGLAELRSLDLDETKVAGAALKDLARLQKLQPLNLRKCPIDDAAVKNLRQFPQLEYLFMNNVAITDAAVDGLAALKGLKILQVQNSRLTPAGVARLRKALPDCRVDGSVFE